MIKKLFFHLKLENLNFVFFSFLRSNNLSTDEQEWGLFFLFFFLIPCSDACFSFLLEGPLSVLFKKNKTNMGTKPWLLDFLYQIMWQALCMCEMLFQHWCRCDARRCRATLRKCALRANVMKCSAMFLLMSQTGKSSSLLYFIGHSCWPGCRSFIGLAL